MSSVSLDSISKRFGDVAVVEDMSLVVPDGCLLVLLGSSGCGKTTSLRIVAGLEEPTSGSVWIGDRDVTRLPPRQRDIAMVFQSYALYPHMSVAENIAYPLRLRGVRDRAAKVREVAERLGVAELLERKPRQLSGGQRQRVALARAIVREPACFLMDEPLSNLDANLRSSARAAIKHLQKVLSVTTVYVTHDQVEATTMADRVAIMNQGMVEQCDAPLAIYDYPVNRFVATFLGSPPMNVVDGSLDPDTRRFAFDSPSAPRGLPLSEELYSECAERGATAVGIRPEELQLQSPEDSDGITGEVYVVESLGNETLVGVEIGDARLTARFSHRFSAAIGDPITLGVPPTATCFFDSDGRTVVHRSDTRSTRGATLPA